MINHVLLGQDMQDFLVRGDGHGLSRIEYALHVCGRHFLIPNGHNAVRVKGPYMTSRYAGVDGINLAPRHEFRLFHGTLNGMDGGIDIDHHPLLQAPGGMGAEANDLERAVLTNLPDDGHHLGGANIEANDHVS